MTRDRRSYPWWKRALVWAAFVVIAPLLVIVCYILLAPIWVPYAIFETIRSEIIARRRLDRGN